MLSRYSAKIPRSCPKGMCPSRAHTKRVLGISSKFTSSSSSTEANMSASLFKNPIVHQLWTARQKAKEQKMKSSATTDRCTVSKSPNESRVEISYPFSTDALLWETYKSPWGQMRFGRILEDLDALAGNIAFFHVNENQTSDNFPIIVTASVDRILVGQRPEGNADQFLSGQVTWTGTSSMEIRMVMTSGDTSSVPWLEAFVTFVTLDPLTHKPMRIAQLAPTTKEEHTMFQQGAARAALKKKRRQQRKMQQADPLKYDHARALLDRASAKRIMPCLVSDKRTVLLQDTALENAMIAQPQVQNLHKRVFGGFLMRRAFELAFSNAYLFGGARPVFLEVDEVAFVAPVDVGDLVVLHSRVLYTDADKGTTRVHIEVEAWVTTPEIVEAKRSNQFYFTFSVDDKEGKCCTVLPSNMDEALRIVERIQADHEQDQQ